MEAFVLFNILLPALAFWIGYLLVKHAVKKGILEAHAELSSKEDTLSSKADAPSSSD